MADRSLEDLLIALVHDPRSLEPGAQMIKQSPIKLDGVGFNRGHECS